jgi:hypothetical protein
MAHAQELRIGAAAAGGGLWRPSWPLLTGLLTFVYFMANGRYLLRDGDTFWHVAVGRWILDHGAIPTSDPFSHTMRGTPWMAHEWPTQIVMTLAHEAGGWTLLVALSAFAFACAIALLTRALLRWLEPIYVLLFAFLAVFMSAGHALARPHFLAMPLLLAWTIELVRARDEQRSPRLVFLPLMTVWANAHGSFTLGLALAGAFALEALLEAWPDRAKLLAVARGWGLFVALAAAASLITPHGPRAIWFTWQMLMQYTYALEFIGEWQSPNFHIFQPLELWLLAGLALVLWQGLRLPPMRIVLLAGLLHLALKHNRYIELVGLIGPLVIAAPFGAQWRERRAGQPQLSAADAFFARLAVPAGTGACALALFAGGALLSWMSRSAPLDFDPGLAPVRAVQAARHAGITGPVLNTYGWGGYLAYAGIPPFIDGRSELYGDAFLKQYREALGLTDPDGFEALVKRWGVTWTLLAPGTPAIALMDHLPDWRRVYADEVAVVHVRVQP